MHTDISILRHLPVRYFLVCTRGYMAMNIEKADWIKQYIFLAERAKLLFGMTLPEFEGVLVDHYLVENDVTDPMQKAHYIKDRMASMQAGGPDLMIEAAVSFANCQLETEI